MARHHPKDKRMEDIICAAVDEFLEKGYEGASMESIARAAGLTKGGLYHHYKGKEEILLAANQQFMAPAMELMIRCGKDPDPLSGLCHFMEDYLSHWQNHPKELAFFFLTMTRCLFNPIFKEILINYAKGMIAFYEELIKAAVNDGKIVCPDIAGTALALYVSIDGITPMLADGGPWTWQTAARHFKMVFLGVQDPVLGEA